MPDFGQAQFVEILSVARARTTLDGIEKQPAVVVTVRPEPNSWRPHNLGLTIAQAERLRDDLVSLLEAPATFLLLAVLALATGCSAKVEVSNEIIPATQAEVDSVPTASPAAALEKHRTAVEIDVLGQREPESEATQVSGEHSATPPKSVLVNMGGIQVNGNENSIEFHYHRCRRARSPVIVCPVMRHEVVIVPSDGSAPVVFMDNAPPRIAVVDRQVARAYASHMLRLTREEGHR